MSIYRDYINDLPSEYKMPKKLNYWLNKYPHEWIKQLSEGFDGFGSGDFKVDIKENDERYEITAELPGFEKENITISYKQDNLTIEATRQNNVEQKEDNYVQRERTFGRVKRMFFMPNVDEEDISAKFENGILTIEAPKTINANQHIVHIK